MCCDFLNFDFWHGNPAKDLIHHSDRGWKIIQNCRKTHDFAAICSIKMQFTYSPGTWYHHP